jgi:OOP family OmpA-OmpF porin|tara:strand:- start:1877 stop:3085 length:1209 start_codon:yes stop_codon:yes gene_type:complete
MIFPRLLSFVLPAVISLTPIQAALAQYQSLDETAEAGAGEPFAWAVQVDAGELTLSGNVPYESVATILSRRAGIDGEAGMTIADGAPLGFLRDAMKAITVSEVLAEGAVGFEDGSWFVTGDLIPGEDVQSLKALLQAVGGVESWDVDVQAATSNERSSEGAASEVAESLEALLEERPVEAGDTTENADVAPLPDEQGEPETPLVGQDVPVPSEAADEVMAEGGDDVPGTEVDDVPPEPVEEDIAEAAANEVPGSEPETDASLGTALTPEETTTVTDEQAVQCKAQVAALTGESSIEFASGRASPTAASDVLIAAIADALAICPSQPVYVEGHTDADGRAETNLVLSLSRAEAVVDRLVDQGIDPQRLFVVGYGASLPVASNDTAAGKAKNRRIVFSFEDIAQ